MKKQREKDLVFWKSTYITWRNVCERAKDPRSVIRFRNTAARVVQSIEAKVLMCLVLGLLLGGCKAGAGVGVDAELFWPNIKTAKGGEFCDPAESREQTTQHTVGMKRNKQLPMVGGD